jgi:lipopolysaccharide export system protein LptA
VLLFWPKHRTSSLVVGIVSILFQHSSAALDADYCAAQYPSITSYQPPPFFDESRRDNIDISANKTLTDKAGSSTFEGNVILERHELRIKADIASLDNTNREISVNGNVHLDTTAMSIDADSGRFFLDRAKNQQLYLHQALPAALQTISTGYCLPTQ